MADESRSRASTVVLALVQMSCTQQKALNVDKALERIAQAAERGAQIVCLQELFASPYPCQEEDHDHFALAEPIPGPTADQLQQAAAEHKVVVIGSLFERRAAGLYHNTTAVFDADGTALGNYRKMHIPDDPLYYEKFYFTPGDLGFRVFATHFGRIGVAICWDQWFPEAARLMALARSRNPVLSHRDWLATGRKSSVWRKPAQRVGNFDARTCDRQWGLCCRDKSSRTRGATRVLGFVVRGRPVRKRARPSQP